MRSLKFVSNLNGKKQITWGGSLLQLSFTLQQWCCCDSKMLLSMPSVIPYSLLSAYPSATASIVPFAVPSVLKSMVPSIIPLNTPSFTPSMTALVQPFTIPSGMQSSALSASVSVIPSFAPSRVGPLHHWPCCPLLLQCSHWQHCLTGYPSKILLATP